MLLIYWSILMPRGRPIVTPLTLTPEQVTSLTQIANSRTAEHRQVQRARILLGAASGKPQKELAEEAKLSVSAVARFLRKALQIGPMVSTLCTWFSRETPNKKRPPRRPFSLRQSQHSVLAPPICPLKLKILPCSDRQKISRLRYTS